MLCPYPPCNLLMLWLHSPGAAMLSERCILLSEPQYWQPGAEGPDRSQWVWNVTWEPHQAKHAGRRMAPERRRREAPREMMTSTSIWRMTTLNHIFFSRPFNSFYNQIISIQISIYSKFITLCSRFCKIRGQSSVLSLHDSVLVWLFVTAHYCWCQSPVLDGWAQAGPLLGAGTLQPAALIIITDCHWHRPS